MSAPEIAYRLAVAPPETIGGTIGKLVALLIATRWAQPDGRFIVRHAALVTASGLSKASVVRAVAALRAAKVFTDLPAEESCLRVDHLPGWLLTATEPAPTEPGADPSAGSHSDQPVSQGAQAPTESARALSNRPDSERRTGLPEQPVKLPQQPGGRTGPKAVSPLTDVSAFPSSSDIIEEEGGDARARAAGEADDEDDAELPGEPFTADDERRLAWLKAQGVLLANPATGEDLRREWLRLTVGVGIELVKRILGVRAGDYPSDFRKAAEPFQTQIDAARRAAGERSAAEVDQAQRAERAERARAEQAALDLARADEQRKRDEERARETTTHLEQAKALLDDIGRADPRRLVLADAGWSVALARLRSDVAAGRVMGITLVRIRVGWPEVRDRQLPPEQPIATPHPAIVGDDDPPPDDAQAEPGAAATPAAAAGDEEPAAP